MASEKKELEGVQVKISNYSIFGGEKTRCISFSGLHPTKQKVWEMVQTQMPDYTFYSYTYEVHGNQNKIVLKKVK